MFTRYVKIENTRCGRCRAPLPDTRKRYFRRIDFVNSDGDVRIRSVSERTAYCELCAIEISEGLRDDIKRKIGI